MYTYDGNTNETYYLIKNGKVIAELFMGEDDASLLTHTLNEMKIEFDGVGKPNPDNENLTL